MGGIYVRNRLMGNSLLDIVVFGRDAGRAAAAKAKQTTVGALSIDHAAAFDKSLADAGIKTDLVSPKLLPNYVRERVTLGHAEIQ